MGKKETSTTREVSKKEKFVQIATPRINKAIKAIHLVGLCASATYEYTPEQARAAVLAMQAELDKVKNRFEGKQVSEAGFVLPT